VRVCIVAYKFYESNTRVLQFVSAFRDRGDTVDVLALRREGQLRHETVDGVHIYRIQRRIVNERGRIAYLFRMACFILNAFVVLTKRHLEQPYDAVHVISVPDCLVFAGVVPKLLGTPVFLDICDIVPEFYASKFRCSPTGRLFRLLVLIERLSLKFSDHVTVTSPLWRDRLISRSASEKNCTTIFPYPPTFFTPRPRREADNPFVILYPGTLNWHQGVDIAIRAFALVASEMPEAELRIYGEGPSKPFLMRLVDELGLKERVLFHDMVPATDIVDVMANADLAVVPKRASVNFGDEAVSSKIAGFMALGVPVIASRTSIETFYYDESVIRFVESENIEALAAAIFEMRHDEDLRRRLVRNGMTYTDQNNWSRQQAEYLGLVDSHVVERMLT